MCANDGGYHYVAINKTGEGGEAYRLSHHINDVQDEPQKASASPPYRFGSSLSGMTCESSARIVFAPEPTTDIFASVAAERSGLKSQKIHVRSVGTLMKYFRDCERGRVSFTGRARNRDREKCKGKGRGTYEELGVVVLEDGGRLLGCCLLLRVALRQADALVI